MEQDREVLTEEGQEFAHERNMHFIETSAKTSANVEDMFVSLAEAVEKNFSDKDMEGTNSQLSLRNLITLEQEELEDDSCCS